MTTDWKHIIADSGGSKTSWAFCAHDGTVRFAETRGLHPKYALGETFGWEAIAEQLGDLSGETLHFYGSGCGRETIRQAMREQLRRIGFGDVHVFPDTLAACRAACEHEAGVVAILGTGSILVEYDGSAITQRIGGYGSLIGDEGSGFHFARLVVRAYLDNSVLSAEQRAAVSDIVGTTEAVLAQLAAPTAQEWIAGLGARLSAIPLENIHTQNIAAFLETHLPQVRGAKRTLHIVGSYGYAQAALLEQLLLAKGWKTGAVIVRPIEQLVAFHA